MKDNQETTFGYDEFSASMYLDANSAAYVEALYEDFLQDAASVEPHWREYFATLGGVNEISHAAIRDVFFQLAHATASTEVALPSVNDKQAGVDGLIQAYRRYGHIAAKMNPLHPAVSDDRLTLHYHGLSEQDGGDVFLSRGVMLASTATLADIHTTLKQLYCGATGFECDYIENEAERSWFRQAIEVEMPQHTFSADEKRAALKQLTAAEGLEKYLDVKYPGQKRFSNEGIDSFIPLMELIGRYARSTGVQELRLAMAHRGRINALVNFLGKPFGDLQCEFDGTKDYGLTTGDVKYHAGYSSDIATPYGPMHLTLAFNPSHLEFISPVVMGAVRARQDHYDEDQGSHAYALAVQVHGDSAFAGQGVVMETLSMSKTKAYDVGGSIHIVLNNQVGFTTSKPEDTRSSRYCSDIAKMIDAPVLHVNADDVEAVIRAAKLAVDYRTAFHKDIVIDLVGFRRHGHQEVDEPRATQPELYKIIDQHPGARTLYAKRLITEGVVTQSDVDAMWEAYRDTLDAGKQTVETLSDGLVKRYTDYWLPYLDQEWTQSVTTAVDAETIQSLAASLETLPENFNLQRNVGMMMRARQKMTRGEQSLDWGYGETMAYASLLAEGYPVRLAGEDCERGTFFHRHAVLHDQQTGAEHMPLAHLSEDQAPVHIYNSLLSEAGALAFEYGYAIAEPKGLVIWEAQFGDFANGAQVIIDQFISSGWQKWNRLSGVVMLLPHGYEGMGPEHSSARLERYMQLCAQDNIQVCVPSTPAQIFHLLRRQVLRAYRKPLIVMSPKSLLRNKDAVSDLSDLSDGYFHDVIDEVDPIDKAAVTQVVACSGKIYYELRQKRAELGRQDIALVRIEQLYPFPYDELRSVLESYPNLSKFLWCQEEPKNQGAWFISRRRLAASKPDGVELLYSCRPASAAPAAGYPALFKKLQAEVIDRVFCLNGAEPFRAEE